MTDVKNWLLPGLGADRRLLQEQYEHSDGWYTPAWIEPKEDESLEDYCKRWVDTHEVIPEFVTGVSFGGIMGLEMAKHFDIKGVVIISGCFSKESITSQFKTQASLLKFVPDNLLKYTVKEIMFPKFINEESLTDRQVNWLKEMANEFDPNFFRWATQVSARWEPIGSKQDYKCPVIQIHGKDDHIIPMVEKDADIVIEGKHLIQYTHASQINNLIQNFIRDHHEA